MNNETTLITDASSGLGMHLAYEFARNGHPLVLTAPDETELQSVAAEIRATHGVVVQILPGDLADSETAERLFGRLQRAGMVIEILVNNAGHWSRGKWAEMPMEQDLAMIRQNIEAVLRMTKLFLPPMLACGRGRVLTTAWAVGLEPGPLLAVYQATKAFVLSWSEVLATELADTPITVAALCSGPTDPELPPKARVMTPQDVAKAGYAGLMKKERVIALGGMDKALVGAWRILPAGTQAGLHERFCGEVTDDEARRIPAESVAAAANW